MLDSDKYMLAVSNFAQMARRLKSELTTRGEVSERLDLQKGETLTIGSDVSDWTTFLEKGWLIIEEDLNLMSECTSVDVVVPGEALLIRTNNWHAGTYRLRAAEPVLLVKYAKTLSVSESDIYKAYERARAAIDMQLLRDRLQISLWGDSIAKLAHLLLQFMDRLKIGNPVIYDRFHLPITQTDLGGLLGITNIHISRTFARLEIEGCIRRYKSFIEIVDREKLIQLCDYKSRLE